MNAVVIEHVRVSELPTEWQHKLGKREGEVTIRIEQSALTPEEQAAVTALEKNPMFGMWRDREDVADVPAYVRSIRASRFNDDGSRRE
jgi:hypothetical protein